MSGTHRVAPDARRDLLAAIADEFRPTATFAGLFIYHSLADGDAVAFRLRGRRLHFRVHTLALYDAVVETLDRELDDPDRVALAIEQVVSNYVDLLRAADRTSAERDDDWGFRHAYEEWRARATWVLDGPEQEPDRKKLRGVLVDLGNGRDMFVEGARSIADVGEAMHAYYLDAHPDKDVEKILADSGPKVVYVFAE